MEMGFLSVCVGFSNFILHVRHSVQFSMEEKLNKVPQEWVGSGQLFQLEAVMKFH